MYAVVAGFGTRVAYVPILWPTAGLGVLVGA